MILTITIPESVVEEAKSRGISVEALVRERIAVAPNEFKSVLPNATPMTPAEAGSGLREMRKRYTLGNTVTIKQLIEEGRRY
jgi:hypothetical protein